MFGLIKNIVSANRRSYRPRRRPLGIEALEDRTMLSTLAFSNPQNISNTPDLSDESNNVFLAADGAQNVFAMWQERDLAQQFFPTRVLFSKSDDAGQSFSTPVELTGDFSFTTPVDLIAEGGTLHAMWHGLAAGASRSGTFVAVSSDGGESFASAFQIPDPPQTFERQGWQQLVIDGNTLHAVGTFSVDGDFDVFYTHSTDGGANFSTPINVSDDLFPSAVNGFTLDSAGNLHLTWAGTILINGQRNGRSLISTSSDNGATFSPPQVADWATLDNSGQAKLVTGGNSVFATTASSGGVQFWRSTDSGDLFTGGLIYTATERQFHQLAASDDGNTVYVASVDTIGPAAGGTVNTDVVVLASTDAGVTFGDPVIVSQDPNFAALQSVATTPDGSRVYVAWYDLVTKEIIFSEGTSSPPNQPPTIDDQVFAVEENSSNSTSLGTISAGDPNLPEDSLNFSVIGGTGATAFAVDADSGAITVADSTQLDFETSASFALDVQVTDEAEEFATATITINVINRPSITGTVFVDVQQNGVFEANEPGIDGVTIELLSADGSLVLDTTTTSDGGFYLFEDLVADTYQLHQLQPSGMDDGDEILGSLGGSIPANDTMQLTLSRTNAFDYDFAEIGQEVTSGDTATIGFWQNKHGQELIAQSGTALAQWLTVNFGNVFGNVLDGASGQNVAEFYKQELFKQKAQKSAGPAKVDAQFMAVAFATFFTSRNLAYDAAAAFGFNVTDTGIGTKIVNVGDNGVAFDVANNTDMSIMQLLLATDSLTDQPDSKVGFTLIYDKNGDGIIDANEAVLRSMANEIYGRINADGDI